MPIYRTDEAKEEGWAQVRAALISFEGDVVKTEEGDWGGLPVREYLEISCENIKVLEVSEELSMDVDGQAFNFRVSCSESKNSFWMEEFVASAERLKLVLPDDLLGKRIAWKKVTREASDPKFNATNFIIDSVKGGAKATPTVVSNPTPVVEVPAEVAASGGAGDPMEVALELAVGKTEQQFRSAISLHPQFVNDPLLPMAKAGLLTASLVKEGKLVEVQEGNKTIYQKP